MGKRKSKAEYRSRKRMFLGNQFSSSDSRSEEPQVEDDDASATGEHLELDATSPSASYSKLREFAFWDDDDEATQEGSDEDEEDTAQDTSGNRIIYLPALADALEASAVCKTCKKGSLVLSQVSKKGLAPVIELTCDSCSASSKSVLAKQQKHGRSHFYDINRKAVLAMRLIGCGLEALSTIATVLDMPPPMGKPAYSAHCRALHRSAKKTAERSMKKAAEDVIAFRDGEDKPGDVAVSTDGTWMRRGHSSLYGVQSAISFDTHQILDVEVLSKHCPQCVSWEAKRRKAQISADQYQEWYQAHKDACAKNTSSSAPAMEAEAVTKLWSRSEAKNNLRYVTYIGDGDSKGHKRVSDAKPYGDVDIVKDECIGHVQKRVGKGLRDLKTKLGSTKLSDGKTLTGKGRLTEKMMDKLQNYYGIAVRSHVGNVDDTYRAIWASLHHHGGSHDMCPTGEESWCKYQKQKAGVDIEYNQVNVLPKAVIHTLKPLYVRLTDRELLMRCVRGATQNVNEAFNAVLWNICPKTSFCGPMTVETATFLAVGLFNHGTTTVKSVISGMHCDVGPFVHAGLDKADGTRVYHSGKKSQDTEKKARKRRRAVKKGLVDAETEKEGVTYGSGEF